MDASNSRTKKRRVAVPDQELPSHDEDDMKGDRIQAQTNIVGCFHDNAKAYPMMTPNQATTNADRIAMCDYLFDQLSTEEKTGVIVCERDLEPSDVLRAQSVTPVAAYVGVLYRSLIQVGVDLLTGRDDPSPESYSRTLGLNVETSALMSHELQTLPQNHIPTSNDHQLYHTGGFVALFKSWGALERNDVVVRTGGGIPWLSTHDLISTCRIPSQLCDQVRRVLERNTTNVAVLWIVVSVLCIPRASVTQPQSGLNVTCDEASSIEAVTYAVPLFFTTRADPECIPVLCMWSLFRRCRACPNTGQPDAHNLQVCRLCYRAWFCPTHFGTQCAVHQESDCGDDDTANYEMMQLMSTIKMQENIRQSAALTSRGRTHSDTVGADDARSMLDVNGPSVEAKKRPR